MRILIGLSKFILGVALAIAIIGVSGFYGARYVMTRLTAPPERPLFPEEGDYVSANVALEEGSDDEANLPSEGNEAAVTDDENNDEVSTADSAPEPEPEIEPGAYNARVIQPIGLILRQGPDVSTTQIGGIAYNENVVVLSESSDQRWIKVRLPDSGVEGWVKNGNVEKLN
ncbi:MAG: SH3 domain-containing protein [Cyanobacteria bacterium P01_F01_bin.150]